MQFVLHLISIMNFARVVVAQVLMREESVREGSFFYHTGDGFFFHRSSAKDGSWYFKCVRYERGCRARAVYTDNGGFHATVTSPDHNHEADPHYADEVALKRNILARCRSLEYVSFQDIIDHEGVWFDVEVSSRVTLGRMRNAMRTARLRNFPNPPASLRDLTRILNDDRYRVLTQTDDGADNLYAGSVTATDHSHHIMFCSERMLQIARTSRILHGDGTVKVVPTGANADRLAQQVYVILTTWDHHVIPIAWVLMESQTGPAYRAVLQLFRALLGNPDDLDIDRVITDFERAQQNEWHDTFPHLRIQGCLWHLVRAFPW